jgi:peptide/nickel transport system substrate-binding protein
MVCRWRFTWTMLLAGMVMILAGCGSQPSQVQPTSIPVGEATVVSQPTTMPATEPTSTEAPTAAPQAGRKLTILSWQAVTTLNPASGDWGQGL